MDAPSFQTDNLAGSPTPAQGTQPSFADRAKAAGSACAPDPVTAEILRKHAAGEKLSASERGKLGAYRAKISTKPNGRPPKAPVANVDAQTAGQGSPPANGPGAPCVDPDLIRRTTQAILQTCDQIAQRYVSGEAGKAGADKAMQAEFARAAALPDGPRELMVQTSPEVCASVGLDSGNYPVAAFLTGLSIWSANLFLVVNRLEKLQKTAQGPASPPPDPNKK